MNREDLIKKGIIAFIVIIIIVFVIIVITKDKPNKENNQKNNNKEEQNNVILKDFNTDIIKTINKNSTNQNNLISPYNILVALNMLNEGADGKTKEEISKVIGDTKVHNIALTDKFKSANAIFIKEKYQNNVKKDYVSLLDSKYQANVLYDKFETPTVINNWVKEKTNGMIDKILDTMDNNFVMGLASALALDVTWNDSFECDKTQSEEFTKIDNSKINVQMMHIKH